MCLIIASHAGTLPEQSLIIQGLKDNPHAWGVASAENGSINIKKGYSEDALLEALKPIQDESLPYVIHFRWSTSGSNGLNNGHPFLINDYLCMAHNGIIQIPKPAFGMSDTWHFVQLLKTLDLDMDTLRGTVFRYHLENEIGPGNKLVFLDKNGEICIINSEQGKWYMPNVWISNIYSTPQYLEFEKWWKGLALPKESGVHASLKYAAICQCCLRPKKGVYILKNIDVTVCNACHSNLTWEPALAVGC